MKKQQPVSPRGLRAGPELRAAPPRRPHDAGSGRFGDHSAGVRRSAIDHDDLVIAPHRVQAGGKLIVRVPGWTDDGQHQPAQLAPPSLHNTTPSGLLRLNTTRAPANAPPL